MPTMSRWNFLSSLRHRDFRLYYVGQLVSLNGTWMQTVAQSWLVYRLTDSSFMLGLVAFLAMLPVLLFGLLGGLLADRLPRRRLFLVAQALAMAQALVLATLALGGWIQVWHVMVLALLLGLVHAFEMPARHTFIAELVPREDLPNAIALNSSAFNIARFVGPTLAGWVVAGFGEGTAFAVNAVTFLAVMGAIQRMNSPPPLPDGREGGPGRLAEGLRFAWGAPAIRSALGMVGLTSLLGSSYAILMPVFTREIFAGGAGTLGLLLGSAGAGAMLAALRLAQRASGSGLDRLIGHSGVVAGVFMLLFAGTRHLGLALVLLPVIGFCFTSLVASANTLIQLEVPNRLRGRVMSLFSVTFIGLTPLGNLVAGTLGHWLGAPLTVALFGGACLTGALTYLVAAPR